MKPRILFVTLCGLAALSAQAAYKDGSYTGSGKGNASVIEVNVSISGGKIAKIDVLKQGETPMLFEAASGAIIPGVIKANGLQGVDAVTGASNSSRGLMSAIKEALDKASK